MSADLAAANLAAHWIQSGVLAAATLGALRLLRVRHPRVALGALQGTVLALLALPVAQPWQPQTAATPAAVIEPAAGTPIPAAMPAVPDAASPSMRFAELALILAAVGAAMRGAWLLVGMARLGRLPRRSRTRGAPEAAVELERLLGVSPQYLEHDNPAGPSASGIFQPTISLPASFGALPEASQRAVLCHELLHISRRDTLAATLEEIAAAMLWFHPWVWLVRARIRVAREQAVDRAVVALLGNRHDYARCLLALSGHDLAPRLAAGMSGSRELRARIDALFKEVPMSRMRLAVITLGLIGAVAATGAAATRFVPLRAPGMLPVLEQTPGTIAGAPRRQLRATPAEYPAEARDRRISGAVMVDVTVNAQGDVTTGSIVSGPPELRASAFRTALGLKFEPAAGSTSTQVSVTYMLTDSSWGVSVGMPGMMPGSGAARAGEPDERGVYRLGGDIKPPRKIHDVPPTYPPLAMTANVQGVVLLEATIDQHGVVTETKLLRSIPLLDQAAIDAVRQWRFEPATLNGTPVPVLSAMTLSFTLRNTVRVRVSLPDGNTVHLTLRLGAPSSIAVPGLGSVTMTATRSTESGEVFVTTTTEDRNVGTLRLPSDGTAVESGTSPSFSIQLVGPSGPVVAVRRPFAAR